MKRTYPSFVFDAERKHRFGETDFVFCADADNAFLAKIDFVEGGKDSVDENTYIREGHNNLAVRLTILKRYGRNHTTTAERTLMRKAVDKYFSRTTEIDISDITDEQLHQFCDILIKNGHQNLGEAGINQIEKNTIKASIAMLTKLKTKI